METDQNQSKNALPCVSPVALELNRLVEKTQNTSPNLFQLPPGTVPGIAPVTVPTPNHIPIQTVQPMVKQETEMVSMQAPTPMETSQQVLQPAAQQQQQQQPQQQQTQNNNLFNKTLLDLLNATNQETPQTSPTLVQQPNPGIILLGNNGQTTHYATSPAAPTQPVSTNVGSTPPMIVILPSNNQATAPAVPPATQMNMQQLEAIVKAIIGQQNGLA